jgi:hypothetical protein
MIEQTELVVTTWDYNPPAAGVADDEYIPSSISLEVQKKRAANKKGIACRFSCRFHLNEKTVLQYVAEDSYVIDLEDEIDKNELLRMIRNSYSKFLEKFEFRKMNTVLYNRPLKPLDESLIDLDAILPLLK